MTRMVFLATSSQLLMHQRVSLRLKKVNIGCELFTVLYSIKYFKKFVNANRIVMLYKASNEMFLSDALSRLRTHNANKVTKIPNIAVTVHGIEISSSLSQLHISQSIHQASC